MCVKIPIYWSKMQTDTWQLQEFITCLIQTESGSWILLFLNTFTGDNWWASCSFMKNKHHYINKWQWAKLADLYISFIYKHLQQCIIHWNMYWIYWNNLFYSSFKLTLFLIQITWYNKSLVALSDTLCAAFCTEK